MKVYFVVIQITPLGKLVSMREGQFSDQFFSASMDGTIKLWDLHSTPMSKPNQRKITNKRFENPENLNSYQSPLHIYNNRLKPTYTVCILKIINKNLRLNNVQKKQRTKLLNKKTKLIKITIKIIHFYIVKQNTF